MTEGAGSQQVQERINYKTPESVEIEVPIIRSGLREMYIALKPPTAEPYSLQ